MQELTNFMGGGLADIDGFVRSKGFACVPIT